MNSKFVFFDLGKVIFDFDHGVGCRQVAEVCGITAELAHEVMFEKGLEIEFEKGNLSPAEFHRSLMEATGGCAEPNELFAAMSDIFTLNEPVLAIIERLANSPMPMGILSNTCHAHWEFLVNGYSFLNASFPVQVVSFEVGAMKPDAKIYEAAKTAAELEIQANLQWNEIFFVDDRPDNVEGALAVGIDAVLYQNAAQLEDDLHDRGIG